MSTPPLLLACAALFWAWQTGGGANWAVALAAGALLEAPRMVQRRFALAREDFNRVSDLCTLLVAGLAIILYLTYGNPRAVTLLFQWLPIALLPLALAQAWSTSRAVDLSVLFWALRRQALRRPRTLDLAWPSLALWLLAASAANLRSDMFYLGLLALCAWAIAVHRPRSFPLGACAGLLLAAGAIGYAGQLGLHGLQQWLEGAVPEWLAGGGSRTDPYKSSTDIGTLGELKNSDAIVLRVERDAAAQGPLLLHRASYDDYRGGTWLARGGRFHPVYPEPQARWTLGPGSALLRLKIHESSPGGNPVLSLPSGTLRLEGLEALGVRRHDLGAVQEERPPGHFSYEAFAQPGISLKSAPTAFDLKVPDAEAPAIRGIAAKLAPGDVLAAVRGYFSANFSYSLYQKGGSGRPTPLGEFLLSTRAGHCEYFASATVLLLRAAGIPARYATGFSVQEYSRLEGAWLARERHAHAWARAWVDGRWVDVDTTPPNWASIEASRASAWSAVFDIVSWARFAAAQWLSHLGDEGVQRSGVALAILLAGILLWRLRTKGAVATQDPTHAAPNPVPGQDSEFYAVERRLAELGWRRQSWETLGDWLARIESQAPLECEQLRVLAHLHNRYRFDPCGLDTDERARLRSESAKWLARQPGAGKPAAHLTSNR